MDRQRTTAALELRRPELFDMAATKQVGPYFRRPGLGVQHIQRYARLTLLTTCSGAASHNPHEAVDVRADPGHGHQQAGGEAFDAPDEPAARPSNGA